MRGDWEEDAACARVGGDLWFPKGYKEREDKTQAEYAVAVCWAECPVRLQCLRLASRREEGLAADSRFGVWGGLTPFQRYVREMALATGGSWAAAEFESYRGARRSRSVAA